MHLGLRRRGQIEDQQDARCGRRPCADKIRLATRSDRAGSPRPPASRQRVRAIRRQRSRAGVVQRQGMGDDSNGRAVAFSGSTNAREIVPPVRARAVPAPAPGLRATSSSSANNTRGAMTNKPAWPHTNESTAEPAPGCSRAGVSAPRRICGISSSGIATPVAFDAGAKSAPKKVRAPLSPSNVLSQTARYSVDQPRAYIPATPPNASSAAARCSAGAKPKPVRRSNGGQARCAERGANGGKLLHRRASVACGAEAVQQPVQPRLRVPRFRFPRPVKQAEQQNDGVPQQDRDERQRQQVDLAFLPERGEPPAGDERGQRPDRSDPAGNHGNTQELRQTRHAGFRDQPGSAVDGISAPRS